VLALLAVSALTPAEPITKENWAGKIEYPAKAKRQRSEGVTYFDLLISPDGKPTSCRTTKSSGSDELDQTTCAVALKQAKFRPARDEKGEPTHMLLRGHFAWTLGSQLSVTTQSYLVVEVNTLPDGATLLPVTVLVKTDESGKVTHCSPQAAEGKRSNFETIACTQATSAFRSVVTDGLDKPVTAIQALKVIFQKSTS
jgi:TonB family protein